MATHTLFVLNKMSTFEIISLIVTIICIVVLCTAFTFLFRYYFLSSIKTIKRGDEDVDIIDYAIEVDKIKKSKVKKIRNIILKVFSYIILTCIVGVFSYSLYAKFTDNVMPFGNSTLIVIASGSMSEVNPDNTFLKEHPECTNQFDTYDIIGLSKYEDVKDVNEGDVIAYKSSTINTIIVHRVIDIISPSSDSDNPTFLTEGDANSIDDSGTYYTGYLKYSDIIGYYNNFKIKGIGSFIVFLQSSIGIITIISIIYCFIIYDIYSQKYKNALDERIKILSSNLDIEFEKGLFKKAGYYEELIYKDKIYTFKEGEFVSSKKLEDNELDLDDKLDTVIFKKIEDNEEVYIVKNTKTNEEIKYRKDEFISHIKKDCVKDDKIN